MSIEPNSKFSTVLTNVVKFWISTDWVSNCIKAWATSFCAATASSFSKKVTALVKKVRALKLALAIRTFIIGNPAIEGWSDIVDGLAT